MRSIVQIVGERIRNIRQARGLSQEQLAFKANLNTSFIGQIERAEKRATIETIEKIVIALDISFEEFFNFKSDISQYADSEVIDKIAFELNGRSKEEQEAVYSFVKQILEFRDRR